MTLGNFLLSSSGMRFGDRSTPHAAGGEGVSLGWPYANIIGNWTKCKVLCRSNAKRLSAVGCSPGRIPQRDEALTPTIRGCTALRDLLEVPIYRTLDRGWRSSESSLDWPIASETGRRGRFPGPGAGGRVPQTRTKNRDHFFEKPRQFSRSAIRPPIALALFYLESGSRT